MKREEKDILKKVAGHNKGLLSPAEMINGVANRNEKILHRLISKKFIEEVVTQINHRTYNFYRITEKGIARSNLFRWISFKFKKYLIVFFSALFGAFLAFMGDIGFSYIRNYQEGNKLAKQVKWEIYENISDTFDNVKSFNQEKTFEKIKNLNPESSILDASLLYWTSHSVRDQLYKIRSGDFGLLKGRVVKDILEFYSLLYAVDENEKQLESVFFNKISAKAETVVGMTGDISDNTKRMRTMGAQTVGKLMFYYDIYDFTIQKNDDINLSTEDILKDLLFKVEKIVKNKKSGELISAYEVAEELKLNDNITYECFSSFDVCALATSHYLLLKTGKVNEEISVYNGYKKK